MNTPEKSQSGNTLRRDSVLNDLYVKNKAALPVTSDINLVPVQVEGSIIYDTTSQQFFGSTGLAWVAVGGGGGSVSLDPVLGSTGTSIIGNGTSPFLTLKGIIAGTGIGVTSSLTDITFTNTSPASSVTLSDTHVPGLGEFSIVGNGTGPALTNKVIAAGANVTITDVGGTLSISSTGSGGGGYTAGPGIDISGTVISNIGVITLSSTSSAITVGGTSTSPTLTGNYTLNSLGGTNPIVVSGGSGPAFTLRGLTNGAGIGLASSGTAITITNTSPLSSLVAGTGIGIVGTTISNIGVTSLAGTANQITASSSTGAVTLSLPSSIIANSLTVSSLTPNSFLYSGTGGLLTTTTSPTNGQLLIGSTGVAPVRSTLTAGSGITITNGAGSITITASGIAGVTTFSAGTTGFTPNVATSGAVTLAGTLDIANGGTGITTTPLNGRLLIGNGAGYTLANLTAGSGISVTNGAGTITIASSGVTTFSAGTTGFTPSVATSGAVTLAGTLARANGGTGLSTAPTNGQLLIGNGATYVLSTLTAGAGVTITNGAGTITIAATGVSGVSTFSAGTTGFTPNVATSGAITLAGTLVVANGGTGITTTPLNGRLLIGNGAGYTLANLTAGAGITITNGAGSITIATSGVAGVSSFSAGTTGFTPNVATTGAITLSGTLGRANGGTGLSSVPAQGQLLIGNGSGYTLALLTAGLGIGVTNGAGSITVSNTGVRSLTSVYPISLSASTGAITVSTTMTGFLARYTANAAATTFNTITGAWSVVWGSGFTAASGIYTVPAAGRYLVNYQVTSSSTSFIVSLMVNGSIYASSTNNSDNGNNCPSASIIVDVPSTPSQFTLRSDQNCTILFQARNAASGPAATFFNVWRLT